MLLSARELLWFAAAAFGRSGEARAAASVLALDDAALAALPPALLYAGELDPLVDDARAYAERVNRLRAGAPRPHARLLLEPAVGHC